MTTFNDYIETHAEKLGLFTTAITRAHGKNHPEAFEVQELYAQMAIKTQAAGETKPNLDAELTQLREVTNRYTIPGDVCETYAAVYNMLAEADAAYQAD